MQSTHSIRAFFIRLAIIIALLFLGDYINTIDLAKHAIRATAQSVVDSTEPAPIGLRPTRMAEGG